MSRLLKRIKEVHPCGRCKPDGLWPKDAAGNAMAKRCDCLRGQLLDKHDKQLMARSAA